MQIKKTKLKGVYAIKPIAIKDKRGFFLESYNKRKIHSIFKGYFVQDNISKTIKKNVFRGLHFQKYPFAQDKIIRVIKGKILDIVLDLRKNSKTFLKHQKFILSEKNQMQIFIPKGFAHGFLTLENNCIVGYKVSNFFKKKYDSGLSIFDEKLKIKLPVKKKLVILSTKDKNLDCL